MNKILIVGMLRDKDVSALKNIFSPDYLTILTDGFAENAVPCSRLAEVARKAGVPESAIVTVSKTEQALEIAVSSAMGYRTRDSLQNFWRKISGEDEGEPRYGDGTAQLVRRQDAVILSVGSLYLAGKLAEMFE